ncbi:MAG: UDP-N-acetylmuramoyl-tripeptide--D-alanyl-D-alanine ligase [Chloroflexota bacterium]|nr:UDP-N-acetylmuramoyl-tripeptide--D-alanyl-D-alanine ligase [Chloroflexota bacterium]
MFSLRDIELATGGDVIAGPGVDADSAFEGVAIDHREVARGHLFVAIRGERVDGHLYIPGAVSNGARAVLLSNLPVEPPPTGVAYVRVPDTVRALGQLGAYWRQKMPARVVGITGSVGKTSTKEALASVLSGRYTTVRSKKSFNNEIGLPLALLSLTPDVQVAVLEMGGAYVMGEIEYLCSLARPQVGVVTNVGYAHVGRMGSIERIAENKSELVRSLPPDGLAVLNRDDPRVRKMSDIAPCPVLWYGLSEDADVRADEVQGAGLKGIRFRLRIRDRVYPDVRAPLLGRHSVHTVLAAAAVAHAEGMDDQQILSAVLRLDPGLRLLVTPGVNGSTLLDDTYNANPASVLAALDLLADVDLNGQGRKVAVLGDMAELGDYAPEGHRTVGARAAEVCSLLYAVGPLSRETALAAEGAGLDPACVRRVDTAEEALHELRNVLREGDMVLLKGSRAMALDKLAGALAATGTGVV